MFALLAVAQFMVVLDTGIVYVALPSLRTDLGFTPAGLVWVMNVYMLAFGGFMLLFGRAADLLGRRRVFMAGLVLFAVASAACGLAESGWQILAGRTLQGLGAAVIAPSALALVTDLFPEGHDRHKAFGIWGGLGGLAGAVGTLVGGLLTTVSWEWTFWVNVPITVAVFALGLKMLPSTGPTASGRVDLLGAAASTAGILLLLYAVLDLGQGGAPAFAAAALAGSAVMMAAFVVRERTAAEPLIPLVLFRLRNVVLGNAANLIVGALLFGMFFVLALHLQLLRGYSPLRAGLATMPISIAVLIGSQLTIRLLARVAALTALAAGLGIQCVALAWWAVVLDPARDALTAYLLPGLLWGVGVGIAIVAAFVVCTSGLHGPVAGAASGAVSTSLQVGGALGVAVLAAVTAARASSSGGALDVGQPAALWVAAGMALLGVPLMVWLRRTWRPAPPEAQSVS